MSRRGTQTKFSPQRLKTQKSKDAIVRELKTLHGILSNTEVPEDVDAEKPAWMTKTLPYLSEERILSHGHKDVRLLACGCIVEFLRIYAPQAPFDDEELPRVFEAIIMELRGLQYPNRGSFARVKEILQSLAEVKSFLLIVEMYEEKVDKALVQGDGKDELLVMLFRVLLTSANAEHTSETKRFMWDILTTCIDDLRVSPPLALVEEVVEALVTGTSEGSNDEDEEEAANRQAMGKAILYTVDVLVAKL